MVVAASACGLLWRPRSVASGPCAVASASAGGCFGPACGYFGVRMLRLPKAVTVASNSYVYKA